MKTKWQILLIAFLLITAPVLMFAQSVGINDDGSSPNSKAMLDVKSTTKGFLPPRMTYAERNAITGAPAGLIVWCTDCGASGELQVYNGSAWTNMVGGDASPVPSSCGNPFVDGRDNKSYSTVLIGTQCWMAQNLNIGTKTPGSAEQTNNSNIEKYCYNDDEAICDIYGGLYQWEEAMQYSVTPVVQGICPTGWHLPTDGEWTTLTNYLGGTDVAGGKMKETGTTHWASPNTGATNSSGFTGLPAGYRIGSGIFFSIGNYGYWWSSSEGSMYGAWDLSMIYSYGYVYRALGTKVDGFSVRCIRD